MRLVLSWYCNVYKVYSKLKLDGAACGWFVKQGKILFSLYLNERSILSSDHISITQIMIASIKTGLKAKLRERGSIISHHLDHSCLIYQEMFFRITFCLDWDVLSMSDWLDANMEILQRKNLTEILFRLVWTRDWDPVWIISSHFY